MLLKQPKTTCKRLPPRRKKPPVPAVPAVALYAPSPSSLLRLPRCFRSDCRCVKESAMVKCPACGSLGTSTEPLARDTIYVEEY